jgi:tetratricopeptide (TPR) repeat protein
MAQPQSGPDDFGDTQAMRERTPGLARARAFFESGDLPNAERVLAELAAGDDASFGVYRQLSRVLLRQRKIEDALAAAREGARRFPENAGGPAMLAGLLMRTDRVEEALKVLDQACGEFPDNSELRLLHGRASLLCGAIEKALESISAACDLTHQSATALLWKCIVLASGGKTGQATKQFRKVPAGGEEFETLCISLFIQKDRPESRTGMLRLAEFAVTQIPQSASLKVHLAGLLVESANPEHALAELNSISRAAADGLPKNTAYRALEIRAAAAKALGDVSGAIAAMEDMHRLRPENSATLRQLYQLTLGAGRAADARSVGRRLNSMGAKKLPPDLARALEEIKTRAEPIPETTTGLDWAWTIARNRPTNRDDWRKSIDWGVKAGKLMLRIWLTDAARNAEIDALFDPFDRSALDSLPKGKGCLIAGSHLGPIAAGTHFATTTGRRFRVFGRGGPEAIVGEGPLLRIPSNSNVAQSLREILREFDSGGMVGFAAELPKQDTGRPISFLGHEISFALLAPRLIWKCRVPSLWWQPLWKNGRIVMEIERLPDPGNDDTFDTWFERWSAAYLARLENVMRGDPENLNLPISIWRYADKDFRAASSGRAAG